MAALKDITGQRFGNLVAIRHTGFKVRGGKQNTRMAVWEFECSCGERFETLAQEVKASYHSGVCPSCVSKRKAARTYKHGGVGTRLFNIWSGIRQRCNNPKDTNYSRYGGRGISVAPEWQDDFSAFRDWSEANGYEESLECDRIDNDGPYAPSNCRWVTRLQNCNNTSRNQFIELNGERLTHADFARKHGLTYSTLKNRINKGWPVSQLGNRAKSVAQVEWRGRNWTFSQLSEETGIHQNVLRKRILKDNMSVETAINLTRDVWELRRMRGR